MPELKILPANVANMIAAGEVVQRPSSVVKELMENAVDAGASSVTVIITDSGRTLVQVIDDGCGMSAEDAVLCFERHATSKIAVAEDLGSILTFGFRGEALASIAAVAEVSLRTRRVEDETGTQVFTSASSAPEAEPAASPVGTNISVRSLFFNIPARRKFLKSDNVEFRHIVEEFTRVALTRPDVAFSLSHNGKDVFVLKAAKSLKFRVLDLLGSSVVGDVVDIKAHTTVAEISGFIGRPDAAKKTLGNQFFFVNGRYFRSPYLHKAVMKAYEEFVPSGLTPSYFIYLSVNPQDIDVNIHPTKTEIKFEEDSLIFQVLYACVKETLGKNSFGASIDFDTEGSVSIPVFGNAFDEYHPVSSVQVGVDPDYNPFDDAPLCGDYDFNSFGGSSGSSDSVSSDSSGRGVYAFADAGAGASGRGSSSFADAGASGRGSSSFADADASGGDVSSFSGARSDGAYPSGLLSSGGDGSDSRNFHSGGGASHPPHQEKKDDCSKLFETRVSPSTQILILQGKYLATPSKSGMMLVNIRRAHERILYEKFLQALAQNSHISQQALFPVQVQVGVENRLLIDEYAGRLQALGFDITPFGTDTVVVNGVPEGYSCEPEYVQKMIPDLLLILSDDHPALEEAMRSSMAEKFAMLGATSTSAPASIFEAVRLIDSLFACENAEYTASGRRILSIIPMGDMDARFR